MTRNQIFPTILILLDALAGGVYAFNLDWRKSIYWFAAAVLTTCVTY